MKEVPQILKKVRNTLQHHDCEVSRVRAMLLMGVAYIYMYIYIKIFFVTTRPTILLLVYLPLNSINQHQDSDVKCV